MNKYEFGFMMLTLRLLLKIFVKVAELGKPDDSDRQLFKETREFLTELEELPKIGDLGDIPKARVKDVEYKP